MKRGGFTLTETMFAMAVIVILAAIAWPVSQSMMNKAKETVCLQNLQGIGVGLQNYLRDHGDRLPVLKPSRKSIKEEGPVMETELLEYVRTTAIFHCPAGTKEFRETGSSYFWNSTQNGRLMSELSFFGLDRHSPEMIPIVTDKESWHPNGTNFLYADSSTSNKIRFGTANR